MAAAQDSDDVPGSAATVTSTLVAEATRKAGLVWLAYGDLDPATGALPAWHVWVDGSAYVVTGGGEQQLPGLADAAEAVVVVPSKDTRARLVTWVGAVSTVAPGSDTWAAVAPVLAAARLNAEGGAPMIERWARECVVVELRPTGQVVGTAEDPAVSSLAATPRATPATTLGRQPKMLGGLRRRR